MVNITSEIFEKSQCLVKETHTIKDIEEILRNCEFIQTNRHTWKRGNNTVVVRIVDDFTRVCGDTWNNNFPYGLPQDTLVITDNFVTSVTQFEIMRLPNSFFGIYAYSPSITWFDPDRRYSFLVNRLDGGRFDVLLAWFTEAMACESANMDAWAYVTFNCIIADSDNRKVGTATGINNAITEHWDAIDHVLKTRYYKAYSVLKDRIPYRNFSIDFDEVATKSWLNMTVETYINDNVLSLSEKTFRSLVTAAPSVIYGSRYLSAWLTQLGFDTCNDIIDKRFEQYSSLAAPLATAKSYNYALSAVNTCNVLRASSINDIRSRVTKSAEHNIRRLEYYSRQWPGDFALWKTKLEEKLKKW